jgi:outer membrane protein OmpA-like peptidoglycan-associated protein
MRRLTLKLSIAALALALGAAVIPVVNANSPDERPGEIGILAGIGLGDQKLVGTQNDTDISPLVGARFAWHFNDRVAFYFDGTWAQYKGSPSLYGDVSEYAFRIGPEWYANPHQPWQFFVNLGIGGMQLKTDLAGNDGRGFVSGGIGTRRGWRPGALRIELRGDRTVSSADDLGGRDFNAIKLIMGWTWGIGPRPKDTDEDGVFDKKDKCPNTPHGAIVDAVGCPKDSDGDGVWDGLDQCPDTPHGWPVDARGCPLDTDADGVADGIDKCPNTTKGCTVNADGCPADADADGVCDGLDKCPNTTKGCRVDARGCQVDSDGDGVCDGIDQCPGTPSGVTVDARGCPPPAPPPPAQSFIPEAKKELVLEKVFFETDSAKLKPESAETLDKVAASLKDFPDVKLQVAGHTDNTGSAAHNLRLSDARASAVMNYLISKGVNPATLSEKGYGMTEPVADNKTAEGRAQNRRVGLRRTN